MYAQNMYYVLGINYRHTSVGKFLGFGCQTQGLGPYDLEWNSHFSVELAREFDHGTNIFART
jgi:hypothetical protein